MKLVFKALKVLLSLGLIFVAGNNYGRELAEFCIELNEQKKK